ncbi:uncharacterized protein JCM15063_001015 [Sporobolomyces koalae]|uniref:uncharacterized protein n=1 Tax=Sporobolomyces koalae TaxID=500713 RepID=UPI0031764026
MPDLPPLTDQQLVASLAGWMSAAFGTWLLIPAWWDLWKRKQAEMTTTTLAYFGFWLAGDGFHLTALLMEKVGLHQWLLYAGILSTMCYYAHKFWWQEALPETEKLTAVGVAMSGWIYTFRGLGLPEEPKKRILGIPRGVFWTIWYTTNLLFNNKRVRSHSAADRPDLFLSSSHSGSIVFAWLAIIVWLLVAWFRVVELAPPKQSHWPNDTKGVIAFVFGWIGFVCWTAPRVYVLVEKEDVGEILEISTASVVVGLIAHFFNMLNIGVLNFTDVWSAVTVSPFFATSVVCAYLDLWRLIRKKSFERKPRHGRPDLEWHRKDRESGYKTAQRQAAEQFQVDGKREKIGIAPVGQPPTFRHRLTHDLQEPKDLLPGLEKQKEQLVLELVELEDRSKQRFEIEDGWQKLFFRPETYRSAVPAEREQMKKIRDRLFRAYDYKAASARRWIKYRADPNNQFRLLKEIDQWDQELKALKRKIIENLPSKNPVERLCFQSLRAYRLILRSILE